MCSDPGCGCGHDDVTIDGKKEGRTHAHPHVHPHGHSSAAAGLARGAYRRVAGGTMPLGAVHAPQLGAERTLRIEQNILASNDALAAQNRRHLAERGVFALNFVSSPGSGKTSLLVDTIMRWAARTPLAVIEGDQQTDHDAARIRATGAPAVQINTGKGCHLDARMIAQALERLDAGQALPEHSLLLIENVGNLVCPSAFDLGEAHKVVILSVTEGEDKPLKYPDMFRAADLMILSKIDLLPYLDFDVEAAIRMARQVRPDLRVICLSVKNGAGCDEWIAWLAEGASKARASGAAQAA
jgi:hydrogenase nickel incorporation protein HypB